MSEDEHEIAQALASLQQAHADPMDDLMPRVYDELRRIAHRQLRAEPAGHTLSTTAVVHEAYLRLTDQNQSVWADRAQFFALAARTMRRILIDYARRHRASRRGGPGKAKVAFDDLERDGAPELAVAERADWLLALDEALARLALLDERLARIVECRFFAGLAEDETAEALGVSVRTVSRDWRVARGWLHQELRDDTT